MTFHLSSCPKRYTETQDKAVSPLETVSDVTTRLNKMFDLSNMHLEQRADAVEGAYSFSSVSDQMKASGKGLTPEQSQASAVMEFAERYSWLHFDYEHADGYALAGYDEIKSSPVRTVDESYFTDNYIDLSAEDKKELLRAVHDVKLKWVKGISLVDYREFYYPLNWHNYNFTSNGLASGNVMEEAIIQALCEVIERENVYRLFGDQRAGNDVDQKSITNPYLRRVLDNAAKAGISFVIKDISFDFRLPTFVVQGTCAARKGMLTYQGCGYGTQVNPEKALIRALSEYFESFSLLRNTEEEMGIEFEEVLPKMPAKNYGFLSLFNNDMLEKSSGVVSLRDLPDWSRNDIKDEIEKVIKTLVQHKYDVIFIDKTLPALGVPVPRIFVPGMRSLMVSEFQAPWFILSEVYFEAGDIAGSEKYIEQSLKNSKNLPFFTQLLDYAKPKKIFKKDYRETLMFYADYKKDMMGLVKKMMALRQEILQGKRTTLF